MEVDSFADIAEQFNDRVNRLVWCTVTTIDRKGRPRSRILHPVWEGSTGWIATGRTSLKSKHIADNPYVSVTYFDLPAGNPLCQQQIYAECKAEWDDDPAEKQRVWDLIKNAPPPVGYDPAMFFQSVENPEFGALKLTPWRVELSALSDLMTGTEPQIWRQDA